MTESVPTGAQWVYFDRKGADSRIAKEIKGCRLSDYELARLAALLERVASGRARSGADIKYLKGEGLWEVRFLADKRTFRLLYSPEGPGTLVLVALVFVPKKSQRLPKSVFDTARHRLESWRATR